MTILNIYNLTDGSICNYKPTMRSSKPVLDGVKRLLSERSFNEKQIQNIIPHLHEEIIKKPQYLNEILDTWNIVMSKASGPTSLNSGPNVRGFVPAIAKPSANFILDDANIDLNYILGDIEPRLLLLDPIKLVERQAKINGLGLTHSINDHWLLLVHAPRGFYLQKWSELMKKFLYIQNNILDFLFDKKKQKEMEYHPLIRNAAVTEVDLDHIRTRYLFAQRCGYVELANMYPVRIATNEPTLKELILSDDRAYLRMFAPYCSFEEYSSFADLIKNHELEEDDVEVVNKLTDLNCI